jgi:hypothetical protein
METIMVSCLHCFSTSFKNPHEQFISLAVIMPSFVSYLHIFSSHYLLLLSQID